VILQLNVSCFRAPGDSSRTSSDTPTLDDFYGLFQVPPTQQCSRPSREFSLVRALVGAGIKLLMDFLLQPPTYYYLELTYVKMQADGSLVLKELYPAYVTLLAAFYWWCILLSRIIVCPLLQLGPDY